MSRRDPHLRIRHMLDHAREALEMARQRTRQDLDESRELELSLVRLLEIVGEAANRVPDEQRERYPTIPWQDIVDFRNRVIHGYDAVDLDIVWEIVEQDLPALVQALQRPSGGE
jgi:uncharacterized protein with HEPN domain